MPGDAQQADQRAALERERGHLLAQLTELGQGDASRLDFDHNFADSSQVTAERTEVEALTASLQESLGDIEEALAKFDNGSYGTCERCGQPIAGARLEAMPAARLCITCAHAR